MKKTFLISLLIIGSFALNAQKACTYQYGANEKDSLQCLEDLTTFRMADEAKNYKDAYAAWQRLVSNCPCAWQGIWAKAQTMFDNLIRNEKDSLQKENLIDSLLWVYEVRHIYQPKSYTKGSGLGYKAYNTMRYRSKNAEKALEWFAQSVEMEKAATQPHIWDVYFKTAVAMVNVKHDTTIVIEAYERATEYIDEAIINCYKKYEKVLPNIDNLKEAYAKEQIDIVEYDKRMKRLSSDTAREMKSIQMYRSTLSNIEGKFTPYAPCNVLEEVYGRKLEANRDNMAVLNKIINTMYKGGCMTSPVFVEALEIVHKANPSAKTAELMGNLSFKTDVDKSIEYFKEAIDLYETNEQKITPYYMLALIYQSKKEFGKAREAALQVLKINPNHGKSLMLIGDLYAQSSGLCSGGDAVPYDYNWAAYDKYTRAASVDPSVAADANAKRAKLTFPSKQEVFMRGLDAGSSYHVGCWIQENTTVKVK